MRTKSLHGGPVAAATPSVRRSWPVARLLHGFPELRLRERVRTHPLLTRVTVGQLVDDPLKLHDFLDQCRLLPQCGEVQLGRLRAILLEEIERLRHAPPEPEPDLPVVPDSRRDDLEFPFDDANRQDAPIPLAGQFYPDVVLAQEDVYLRMWRLAQFERFIYLPSSVPAFAKTRAVTAAEHQPQRDISDYRSKYEAIGATFEVPSRLSGLILTDAQVLGALFTRQGRYRWLTAEDVEEQLATLRRLLDALPPAVVSVAVDFEMAGLSPGSIVGPHMVLYAMGGYLYYREPPIISALAARCHTAYWEGHDLRDFLTYFD